MPSLRRPLARRDSLRLIDLVGKPSSDPRFIPIDYRVVVLSATTGAEIGAVPVQFPRGGKQDLHVNDLDLDGDSVVVNWSTWDGHKLAPQKPLVANLQHETVTTIPLAGTAHIAHLPPVSPVSGP